jgi:hypothetical protein
MPMGILFWVLMILWAIALIFGGSWTYGPYASGGTLFVLLGLLGWKTFGPPLQ